MMAGYGLRPGNSDMSKTAIEHQEGSNCPWIWCGQLAPRLEVPQHQWRRDILCGCDSPWCNKKVGHNEEVKITTPVIVAGHNGKSRMVGDFRALKTYTVPDRYPIPKIQLALTQISQAVYITTMDAVKGFHQNLVTPRARKYLRIIVHCGVY
ncbi:hypothetical protein O181_092726 [Austropuccinia psidii MF-1]|uniref:Reverse transcriptase domain-containing protein n=1 Tax=Austropuccinia psidii MF-1 TaxID=1389203 RepID=A0A9Q3PAW5_9BASI|nr:hypothetical protein [Austropuccinia psidii MF-1]